MKKLLIITSLAFMFLSACRDPCKDVACYNNGYCTDGTCSCPVGAEGADCKTETRMKYMGIYKGTYIEDGISYPNSNITVSVEAWQPIVRFKVGNMSVLLNTATNFDVESQQLYDGVNLIQIQSGLGTCNGSSLNYQMNFNAQGANHTASFSGTHL